jgi:hypothetical protein
MTFGVLLFLFALVALVIVLLAAVVSHQQVLLTRQGDELAFRRDLFVREAQTVRQLIALLDMVDIDVEIQDLADKHVRVRGLNRKTHRPVGSS